MPNFYDMYSDGIPAAELLKMGATERDMNEKKITADSIFSDPNMQQFMLSLGGAVSPEGTFGSKAAPALSGLISAQQRQKAAAKQTITEKGFRDKLIASMGTGAAQEMVTPKGEPGPDSITIKADGTTIKMPPSKMQASNPDKPDQQQLEAIPKKGDDGTAIPSASSNVSEATTPQKMNVTQNRDFSSLLRRLLG